MLLLNEGTFDRCGASDVCNMYFLARAEKKQQPKRYQLIWFLTVNLIYQ